VFDKQRQSEYNKEDKCGSRRGESDEEVEEEEEEEEEF
jgi:hypothetical protein